MNVYKYTLDQVQSRDEQAPEKNEERTRKVEDQERLQRQGTGGDSLPGVFGGISN